MTALGLRPDPPARAAADDAAVAFVRAHQVAVWRYLRLLGCPAHAADELTQEALLVGLDKEPPAAAARGFLLTTARHLWLRRRRDDRRGAERLAALATTVWQREHDADDGAGWLAALRACLDALPPRARHCLQRCYGDGTSRAELAAELGLGEHGVRSLLQRLRQRLRTCIERRRQP